MHSTADDSLVFFIEGLSSLSSPRQGVRGAMSEALKWPPRSLIEVSFLNGDIERQRLVREAAREWMRYANVTFAFRNEPDAGAIRVAFSPPGVCSSFVGTACEVIARSKATLCLGASLVPAPGQSEEEARERFFGYALHEFGHALGLIHEHQQPASGIQWDRDAVIAALSGPPNNWSLEVIERNVFQQIEVSMANHTVFDPDSIMVYPIPAAWTLDGYSVKANRRLSALDKQFIAAQYP
jgi:serralysin